MVCRICGWVLWPGLHLPGLLLPGLLLLLAMPTWAQPPQINEFMASNATTIADEDGDYSDWIELYNPGPTTFDLTGCYLSDDSDNPLRWSFPTVSLPAQGFLLVWASGKDRTNPDGQLHTNFAISAAGEPLLLTAADGSTRLDEVAPIALATDISHGRLPDGAPSWVEFAAPTPGASNSSGLLHLEPPVFSQAPGFFTSEITLALSLASPDPEAVITYTLDGSEPTLQSPVYSRPLTLTSRSGDPNNISLIPTNFRAPGDHYGWRPPRGEVFKLNLVRARAFCPGHAPSRITTGSYVIDPDLAGRIPLPVISIATDAGNLFDHTIGLYVPGIHHVPGDDWTGNYFQTGDDWERPLHVEFFDLQGTRLLAQDAGMRMHGGISRFFPQKSFRLHARSEYGPSRFECALFPDLPYTSYNRFLIRNSGNDWGQRGFRDFLVQTMVADMGFDTQAGRPVIHFLNGEYWGLANLRERYDRFYVERCYGVPADEVTLLFNNATIEEGSNNDRLAYLQLRSYVLNTDLNQPGAMDFVHERMDLENFTAYNIAEIYFANYDWPGNNVRFWRRSLVPYDPGAPYGHDGRWRWMMYDMDHAFFSSTYNMLAHAVAPDGEDWPNPPWSTALLRGLLTNHEFRFEFINAFADHLNTTFAPQRLVGIIDEFADLYAPAIADWQDRWDITYGWAGSLESFRYIAQQRPFHQRQHIISQFELDGVAEITLDVGDPAMGRVRVNQIVIDHDLPGLVDPTQPYPWQGVYFQGVPLAVTALPAPGHQFVAWLETGDPSASLHLLPGQSPITLTAVFAPDEQTPVVLQAWHFNDLPAGTLTTVAADHSLTGGAAITYPGTGPGYLDRVDDGTSLGALPDTPAGYALRVRNPSDTRELVLTVPSPDYRDLSLSYAVTRTTNGAQTHSLYYQTAAGGDWQPIVHGITVVEGYQLFTHDLRAFPEVDDNADLALKFTFGGSNAPGTSGNQRFDNFTLLGTPIAQGNQPPTVVQPVGLQQPIAGNQPLNLDLATVFADPDGDPLQYTAVSDDPTVASVALAGSQLTITPHTRGEARLTVTAADRDHGPVAHGFRALVHPEAAVLAEGAFAFTAWDPDLPEGTYPEHMLFLQSAVNDPGPEEPLLFAYHIPHDDYHEDDAQTIGFPYNNTARTRINGLGPDGISLVNSGRWRDLGGALLAIDTREIARVEVSWLGGTILPNDRIYAIRLQYRLGSEGAFTDLRSGDQHQLVEYLRSTTPGDAAVLGPVPLPAALMDQPYVQLLWRYYHVSGTAGARAELRLDELLVTGAGPTGVAPLPLPETTALHGAAPNPFNPSTEIRFAVRAGETARLDIYNGRGQRVRQLGSFTAGRHRLVWDGADQHGQRCASGVYFVRLQAPSRSQTRKILMLK